ncbi:MAG: hypothetical protein WCX61_02200, partial [Candidatus Peribacteraceae bacterium]
MSPDRDSGTKLMDNIFGGVPNNIFTSDDGVRIKALNDINAGLDRHNELMNRSLAVSSAPPTIIQEYLPAPEVYIDTSGLEIAQYETTRKLEGVLDAQRKILATASEHTPLFKQMISNQGFSSQLLATGNQIGAQGNQLLATGNQIGAQGNQLLATGNQIGAQG